jgi:hypothetical protein
MSDLKKKLSTLVAENLPEFIKSDHNVFAEFVKIYYEFLESAELKLNNLGSKDSIITEDFDRMILEDETISKSLYRDPSAKEILLEDYDWTAGGPVLVRSGNHFVNGEIIIGQISKATATIRVVDVDDNSRLFISSQNKFLQNEQIVGQTSNAAGYIFNYTPNPVESISDLMKYADVDDTIDSFFDEFKTAFLKTIPKTLAPGVNKKNILKNITDLYRTKGTRKGHEIFFRLLLDENVEIFYPTENVFRISGGKWSNDPILRVQQINDTLLLEDNLEVGGSQNDDIYLVLETGNQILNEVSYSQQYNLNNLVGETITQELVNDLSLRQGGHFSTEVNAAKTPPDTNSYPVIEKATGLVEAVTQLQIGTSIVYDLVLSGVVGTFIAGQKISGQDNTKSERTLWAKVASQVGKIDTSDSGQYFVKEDPLNISSLHGDGLIAEIAELKTGSVDNVIISTPGQGYEIGDKLFVDNTGTFGASLKGEISVVNGGIAPETGSLENEFRLIIEDGGTDGAGANAGDEILIENGLYLTQEINYGMGAEDHFILEDELVLYDTISGNKLIQERDTGIRDITDIRLKRFGDNYQSLPSIYLPAGSSTLNEGAVLESDATSITLTSVAEFHFPLPSSPGTIYIGEEKIKYYGIALNTLTGCVRGAGGTTAYQHNDGSAVITYDIVAGQTRKDGIVIAYGDGNIGKIAATSISEPGVHYSAPTITTVENLLLINLTGNPPVVGQIVTSSSGGTALIKGYNTKTQLMKISSINGDFSVDDTLTQSVSSFTGKIFSTDKAVFSSIVSGAATFGAYINQDGWISEDSKKIQDSYYFQDFSYVVKTATSIGLWRDSLLSSVHPAGFALFGEINPIQRLDLRIKTVSTSSAGTARELLTPPLFSTFKTIFTTKHGRRLGTEAETLSTAPESGVSRNTELSNDKDVTLFLRMSINREPSYPLETVGYNGYGQPNLGNFDEFKFTNSYLLSARNETTSGTNTGFYESRQRTTLNEGAILSAGDATITLTDATEFPAVGTILIDSEEITYTGKSGNDLTGCARGANSTTATTHTDGSDVYNYVFVITQKHGYRIQDWSNVKLGDIIDYPGRRWYIPAPSEITIENV